MSPRVAKGRTAEGGTSPYGVNAKVYISCVINGPDTTSQLLNSVTFKKQVKHAQVCAFCSAASGTGRDCGGFYYWARSCLP